MNDLVKAKQVLLENDKFTFVACKGEDQFTSILRGVQPLLKIIDNNIDISKSSAADKVVGKATALLYVYCDVKEVYAKVISKKALAVFEKNGIAVSYDTVCEYIINRDKTGMCPMEKAVENCEDPAVALNLIKDKIIELKITRQ